MTQVNFYTLSKDLPDARLLFACRLTEKARELGRQVCLYTDSPAQAKQLDELLWQFRAESFIPHQLLAGDNAAPEDPVVITSNRPPAACRDVLINLSEAAYPEHQQFARINEIVAADEASRESGRTRYRVYREAGTTLETFKL